MGGNSRGNLVWGNSQSFFPAWSGFPSGTTAQIWSGWAGTNAASYSLAQGGVTGPQIANTILTNAPSFVSTNTGNFSLATGSPGIDAGDPTSPLDPDGTRADTGYRSDRFVPPISYGFNYLRLAASQAGSDADIDDLVIRDLDRNVVVYSNSFTSTNLSDFRTMFEADTPALTRNLQYGNTNYVRVVNGRLRMESIGYSGGDGRDTYESWAAVDLLPRLPSNFELSFVFNRLNGWAGHFILQTFSDPLGSEESMNAVFSGHWFHGFNTFYPTPVNALPAQLTDTDFYTSDIPVRIVKSDAQVQLYIKGSLVATAQPGPVTDSDGDGLTDRFEEGSVRYSRIEWGRKYSWADARTHAAGWGRYRGLATVTSEAERTAVLSLFSSTSDLLWLGGTDEVAEGSWKWITGETWGFVPSGSTLSSGTADLDYLRMQGSGAWTSQASSEPNAYLLEAGYRTSASNPDTDGDGISDLDEYLLGLNPVDGLGAGVGTPPAITFTNFLTGTVGAAFSNTVTASGSTPITFSASNLPAGLAISTNGVISGTPTTAGTNSTILTASNPAGETRQTNTVVIAKGTQNIIFGSLPIKYLGDAAFNLTASAGSGLTVTYTSSNTNVATVLGSLVTIMGEGTTTITASQAGNSNWNAATSVPQPLTVQSALNRGLVAYYPFNGNYEDESGNGMHLTIRSGASLVNGPSGSGNAVRLAPTSYAETAGNAGISQNASRTISFWFASDAPQPHPQGYAVGLGSFGNQWNGNKSYISIDSSKSNGIIFVDNDYRNIWSATVPELHQRWHHVVWSYQDNLAGSKIYIDGQLFPSSPEQAGTTILNTPDGPITLGRRDGIGFQGVLDNVRIYNRVISSVEVGQLYQLEVGNLDTDGDGLTDAWERGYGRYQIIPGSFTATQAKVDAAQRGGAMATFTSLAEWQNYLAIYGPITTKVRIGLEASNTDPTGWAWVTGEAGTFRNWDGGQPNGGWGMGETTTVIYDNDSNPLNIWHDFPDNWGLDNFSYLLEFGYPTDPTKADTDGDGFDDKAETLAKTDPNDPLSYPQPGWDFEFGFAHINEAGAETYLQSTSRVKKYTEWQTPPLTYWGPDANDVDAALTYRFAMPKTIVAGRMKGSLDSYNFPWPGYYGSGQGWSSFWASTNGTNWVLLMDNPRPTDNVGRGMTYDQLLPAELTGSKELWVQVRMRVTGAPNNSYTTAQFARGTSANTNLTF